jgi:hypothetical protein
VVEVVEEVIATVPQGPASASGPATPATPESSSGPGAPSPGPAGAVANPTTGRYSFAAPDANDIEALLDLGESAASFSRRATAVNHVPQRR